MAVPGSQEVHLLEWRRHCEEQNCLGASHSPVRQPPSRYTGLCVCVFVCVCVYLYVSEKFKTTLVSALAQRGLWLAPGLAGLGPSVPIGLRLHYAFRLRLSQVLCVFYPRAKLGPFVNGRAWGKQKNTTPKNTLCT